MQFGAPRDSSAFLGKSYLFLLVYIYSQKETAPWVCKLQYMVAGDAYLVSGQAREACVKKQRFDSWKLTDGLATFGIL